MASNFLQRTTKHSKTDSNRESSPSTSSVELRPKRAKLTKHTLSKSKRKRDNSPDSINKQRLRDLSPASSNEPLPYDKRIRQADDAVSSTGSSDDVRKSKKYPRWRKKYLIAGLFSDYYKGIETKQEPNGLKSKLVYNPDDHPHGLLPPPYHCGKYLRNRKQHFQLPYDIWWQHTHSKLPYHESVPSWNYRKIRSNVYYTSTRNNNGNDEVQTCNCSEKDNCGDDCINRLVLSECPAIHKCKNQRIQKHDWAPGIDKFMTEDKVRITLFMMIFVVGEK